MVINKGAVRYIRECDSAPESFQNKLDTDEESPLRVSDNEIKA